jgi:molecular chaperone GrpE
MTDERAKGEEHREERPGGPEPEAIDASLSEADEKEAAPEEIPAPEEDVETLTRQRDQYLDMAQRARAELENYRKRAARELESERKYAAGALVASLLPAMDNLDRAIESASSEAEPAGLVEGIRLVRKELLEALAKNGVTQVDPEGAPFDPHLHEAVSQFPTADAEPMTVLQTLRKGYCLHDRVIRPAHVIVAAAPAEESES